MPTPIFIFLHLFPLGVYLLAVMVTQNDRTPCEFSRNVFWMLAFWPLTVSVFSLYWVIRIVGYMLYLREEV